MFPLPRRIPIFRGRLRQRDSASNLSDERKSTTIDSAHDISDAQDVSYRTGYEDSGAGTPNIAACLHILSITACRSVLEIIFGPHQSPGNFSRR